MKKCVFCSQELVDQATQCGRCGQIQAAAAKPQVLEADKEIVEELDKMRRILTLSK